jgi:UDP-glucuronate 4-epimerase
MAEKILITGTAGFIGFHLAKQLLKNGCEVVGLDNINDYYDVNLKYARLRETGIEKEKIAEGNIVQSTKYKGYRFVKLELLEKDKIMELFKQEKFDKIVHLAAQAGVRYSIENPWIYIESNIIGFLNILEACRHNNIKHLVYASSSSVYGLNKKMPLSTSDNVDHPISLYAATKKSDELMAHTYSYLYNIPITGLRFFTVYGPWGRPDMALFLFTKAIMENKPIDVYNYGDMVRDFTYIDDIIEGVVRVTNKPPTPTPTLTQNPPSPPSDHWSLIARPKRSEGGATGHLNPATSPKAPYRLYNIGNSDPIKLMDFIEAIEKALGKKAKKNLMPMQPGDVPKTFSDVKGLEEDMGYKPDTPIGKGISEFIGWYSRFYEKDKRQK